MTDWIVRGHFMHDEYTGLPMRYVPTPHRSGKIQPRLIVMHDSTYGETLDEAITYLNGPKSRSSAHFLIGLDGEIVQLAPTNIKTWHCGKSAYSNIRNVNNFAIGIQLLNPGLLVPNGKGKARRHDGSGKTYDMRKSNVETVSSSWHGLNQMWLPYTAEQYTATHELCLALNDEYPIEDIVGHYHVSPGRKIDPNPLFPLKRLRGGLTISKGPRDPRGEQKNKEVVFRSESALAEVDEVYIQDAMAVVDCNIRGGKSTSAKLIGRLSIGAGVNILEPAYDDDGKKWFLISAPPEKVEATSDGVTDSDGLYRGYIMSDFLRLLD